MNAVERKILKIYEQVFKKIYNKSGIDALKRNDRTVILKNMGVLETSKDYEEFAKKYSQELAKLGIKSRRGLWRKYYEAAKKLHYVAIPKTWTEYEMTILSKAVKHNFEMIKSIPRKTVEVMEHKYTSTLIEEVAKGKLPRGSFYRELASHGHKRAKLVARTETAKLQTAITETRARDLGSVAYFWLASNDKRTRPSHRAMNGVIVFWKDEMHKPLLDNMRGNAGEFPNCRCDTEPIVDLDQLSKSNYKVYDYRIDKVVTMSKNDVIKAFEQKQL